MKLAVLEHPANENFILSLEAGDHEMPKTLIATTVAGLTAVILMLPSNAVAMVPQTSRGLGNAALSSGAGSAAAGANSAANPSGNAFINTSPSGSTLLPTVAERREAAGADSCAVGAAESIHGGQGRHRLVKN